MRVRIGEALDGRTSIGDCQERGGKPPIYQVLKWYTTCVPVNNVHTKVSRGVTSNEEKASWIVQDGLYASRQALAD